MKSVNKIGKIVDNKGKTVVQMFGPRNALMNDADPVSAGIYFLSETVIRGLMPNKRGGFLGGPFGYACEYNNKVFQLYPDYQDYDENSKRPDFNFRHHASGLEVCWYKWIGRDMKINRDSIPGKEWAKILRECWLSIPAKARAKAKRQHAHENSPAFIKRQQEMQRRFMEVLINPKKYNAPIQKTTCNQCGKEYEYQDWATRIVSSCDDCSRKHFAKFFGGMGAR